MKKFLLFFFLFFISLFSTAQKFTWIRGSNAINPGGNYGSLGITSSTIDPGGRHGSATWVDKNGKFWLLGGEGFGQSTGGTCWLNDLWRYDPLNNQWTWIHGDSTCNSQGKYGTIGVPSSTAYPGGREFAQCWTDTAGMLWLLGGAGYAGSSSFGAMNDFWRYNPTTNQWTWMGGSNTVNQFGNYGTQGTPAPSNFPGARQAGGTWTGKDGHLYLFGGRGYAVTGSAHFLNDLWRYNIATNQWTWIKGSNLTGQPGVFGTLGTPATANTPGGKEFPATWQDATGALYLFGGRGAGYFNDLWKYDVSTNNWTWIHGANVANQKGQYGTPGVASSTTVPGGRLSNAGWVDPAGDFWLFGGQGWSATTLNLLNDLWRYDPCSNEWTWMKGSDTTNRYGIYGTAGQTATTSIPGSRFYINTWTDKQNKPWLMGGEGFDAGSTSIGHMNDIWNLEVPKRSDSLYSSAKITCSGKTATLSVNSAFTPVTWYAATNPMQSVGTGTSYVTPVLSAVNPTTVSYLAQTNCPAKPKAVIVLSVQPLPQITVVNSQTEICLGASVMLSAVGAVTYSLGGVQTPGSFVVSPTVTTTYTIAGTDSFGCVNSTTLTQYVQLCVGDIQQPGSEAHIWLYPNPATDKIHVLLPGGVHGAHFYLYDLQGNMVLSKLLFETERSIPIALDRGLYIYHLNTRSGSQSGKLIIN